MKSVPAIDDIIKLATPPAPGIVRENAVQFLIQNMKTLYEASYKPEKMNIPFLPVGDGTQADIPSVSQYSSTLHYVIYTLYYAMYTVI